jgi:hypothetical protein
MSISIGISCEKCGIVYLITTKANNRITCLPRTAGPAMFSLKCSCGAARSFHKGDVRPYSVSEYGYDRGYAERGEYSVRQDLARIPLRKASS